MNKQIKHFFSRFYDKIFDEDTLGNAAQVAFYFSFSLFPLLLFLISLFGLVLDSADEFRLELFAYLRRIMPITAYDLVFHTMNEVIEKSSGGKITIGILIALWSSSAGLDSLRSALNEVYHTKETRPYWKTKPLSLFMTLLIGLLIFTALGIIFYGSQFVVWLLAVSHLPIPSPFFLGLLKWITIFGVLLFAFALVYNVLPNRQVFLWQWITPGSIAGIILWLLASNGFRIYLGYFDSYSKTYGSLGAMIILMLWLYITALVILIGAVINQILEEIYDKLNLVAQSQAIAAAHDAETNQDKISAEHIPALDKIQEKSKNDYRKEESTDTFSDEISPHQQKTAAPLLQKDLNANDKIETASAVNFNKPLVSLTVVGVFGLLMGLMFRKKPGKP